jgi:ABC-type transporter Mla MlaB component
MPAQPPLYVDVDGLKADAAALDALARVALTLRRCGHQLRLCHASAELLELIELAGLTRVLPADRFSPDWTEPRC